MSVNSTLVDHIDQLRLQFGSGASLTNFWLASIDSRTSLISRDLAGVASGTSLTNQWLASIDSRTSLVVSWLSSIDSRSSLIARDLAGVASGISLTNQWLASIDSRISLISRDLAGVASGVSLLNQNIAQLASAVSLMNRYLGRFMNTMSPGAGSTPFFKKQLQLTGIPSAVTRDQPGTNDQHNIFHNSIWVANGGATLGLGFGLALSAGGTTLAMSNAFLMNPNTTMAFNQVNSWCMNATGISFAALYALVASASSGAFASFMWVVNQYTTGVTV